MLKLFRSIFPFIYPYWKRVVFFGLCSIPLAGIKTYQAYLVKDIFDKGLSPDATFRQALFLAGLLVFLQLINYPFRFWHFYGMHYTMDRVALSIREKLFDKYQRLPMRFFNEKKQGDLISRAMSDSHHISVGLRYSVDLIREPLTGIGLLGVAFYHSWKLTLIILVIFPFFIVIFKVTGRLVHRYASYVQGFLGQMTHSLSEGLEGQKIIKSFNLQDYINERFAGIQLDTFKFQLKNSRVDQHSHPLVETIGAFAFGGVIIFAHHLIVSGEMTTGAFISFIAALAMFMDPIRKYSHANIKVKQALASFERYDEVMQFREEQDIGTVELEDFSQGIEFKNVSFGYKEGEPILKNISFTLKKGQRLGLVGLSGSGKSTIISLLLRLYDVDQGEILIDGHPIKEIRLCSLRKVFSLVSQDIFLFNDTILENIKVGQNYSEQKINQALEISYVNEFLKNMPEGLQTMIGDRGLRLSGGQKQRITIARAFLQNSPVMLFDEATSALDNESEKMVQAAMDKVAGHKTVIAVAHRLSTIQDYDHIIALKDGKKVEEGTHHELMEAKGEYFKLYELSQRS